jgi:4-amino-4-deoxy-L-arabinose transferase-like glycosyltransferase
MVDGDPSNSGPFSPLRGRRGAFASLALMVLAGLAVRLVVMGFLYPEQLEPGRDHWKFAYETGRLARSILQGKGVANPLFEETGPSAWMTPLYPGIVAGVFKVFGLYTKTSALVLLSLNALTSALNCLPIFYFARRGFGNRVAIWSGWAWAFFPYAIYFPVERIWPTWLATLLLSVLFLLNLKLEESDSIGIWLGWGILWGLAALTEPIVLSVLPFLGVWVCYRRWRRGRSWFLPPALAALAFLAVVSPWFVRNHRTFHQFILFRDTIGLELIVGNNGDSFHWHPSEIGPWHNEAEWTQFKRIGELPYMEEKKQQAYTFIKSHPGWFAWETVRRFIYIWTGFWSASPRYLAEEPLDPPNVLFCTALTVMMLLGLRRAFRYRDFAVTMPYVLVLLIFPLIFYVTHPEVYYRRQIDPMVLVLAVYGVLPRAQTGEAGTTTKPGN